MTTQQTPTPQAPFIQKTDLNTNRSSKPVVMMNRRPSNADEISEIAHLAQTVSMPNGEVAYYVPNIVDAKEGLFVSQGLYFANLKHYGTQTFTTEDMTAIFKDHPQAEALPHLHREDVDLDSQVEDLAVA